MKTAAQIMKKKAGVRAEIEKRLPKEQADALWARATEKLASLLARHGDLPKGVRSHTDTRIFPSAAVYLTAKESLGETAAFAIVENAAAELTTRLGKKLSAILRLPGMRSLFIRIWDPMTRRLFGSNNGFENVFYPKKKGEYRMDVLGCPELTRIFCENDERMYGNLPGILFQRTGTLGKDAQRCDFCIRKT